MRDCGMGEEAGIPGETPRTGTPANVQTGSSDLNPQTQNYKVYVH